MSLLNDLDDLQNSLGVNTIFTKNNRIQKYDASNYGEVKLPTLDAIQPLTLGTKEIREGETNWQLNWQLPIEPLISVSGKNIVVKRNTVKNLIKNPTAGTVENVSERDFLGSIKERWSQDDYEIHIEGKFMHSDPKTFPGEDLRKLVYYIKQKQALFVKNELLNELGVNNIVIESFNIPFTKGENVQNYTIEAVSDCLANLYINPKIEIQNV